MGRRRYEPPAGLAALARRVARWRRTRTKRGPMPEALWEEAVEWAKEEGLSPVARTLGIDYGALRDRVAQRKRRAPEDDPSFVEVPLVTDSATTIEISLPDGTRFSVRHPAFAPLDLAALVSTFLAKR